MYRIGSITKPFTAVMLMQLAQAGKVRLANPVEKFFPEIRQVGGMPSGASPPTLLQLATMTGGLAREPREEGRFWRGPVSRWQAAVRDPAEDDHDFFVKAFDAQVSFVTDSHGNATELIVHRGGESVPAKRIE